MPDHQPDGEALYCPIEATRTDSQLGAFFLTFAVGVAALSGSGFVPLAAGASLMAIRGVIVPAVREGRASAGCRPAWYLVAT
jgi:hypothetical protein